VDASPSRKRSNVSPDKNRCSTSPPEACTAHPLSETHTQATAKQSRQTGAPDPAADAAADASIEAAVAKDGRADAEGADCADQRAMQVGLQQAEMDDGAFAADDTNQEMEDANNAAEELLRVN
jgi:hypothetical protein